MRPGLRSAAVEPEVLMRKHFGWPGLGAYSDSLYRWNRTTGNDQYIVAIGFFQQIKGWELDAGYRHLQTLSGGDIIYDPNDPASIVYPREVREIMIRSKLASATPPPSGISVTASTPSRCSTATIPTASSGWALD